MPGYLSWYSSALLAVLLLTDSPVCSQGRIMRLPSMSGLFSTRMVAGSNALKRTTSGLHRGEIAPPVPVFMMMPLDTVLENNTLSEEAMACLPGVKEVGAEGIMVDVWWGLCEKAPGVYDFTPYVELLNRCAELGLKVQTVMSFHGCGGNIGDTVNIPIPDWVTNLEDTIPELFYRDRRMDPSREYVSLSCDNLSVFPGKPVRRGAPANRTALEMYEQFMAAFRDATKVHIDNGTLVEIQVGCGPCGELRYPSYPLAARENHPAWQWPGIGELQCYDEGMQRQMREVLGRDKAPDGVGGYNDGPDDTVFWAARKGGVSGVAGALRGCLRGSEPKETWDSPSGAAFLGWYSGALVQHGRDVLRCARDVFGPTMRLATKVSGIHWLRGHPSRAAEATAGYCGDYLQCVCEMLAETNSVLDFTCFEMRDALQSWFADSRPQELVQSAAAASTRCGIEFAGENALYCWHDEGSVETIEEQAEIAVAGGADMVGLTALRLEPALVAEGSPQRKTLERFVANMKDLAGRRGSRGQAEKLGIWAKRVWNAYKSRNY
mmetsp:Transcript_28084/g.67475  ORF Transcript_28084/g.67475 Transcript_28084/m.67475 type:complete len:549 (-) Transcript_28084:61-1707(-)